MRNRISVTVTADVAVISTDGGTNADADIGPTDDGRMYVQLQKIECTYVFLSYVLNFSQQFWGTPPDY